MKLGVYPTPMNSNLFTRALLGCGLAGGLFVGSATAASPAYTPRTIADDVVWWWALTIADVDNDGLQDAVYIHNNANGGYLAYRSGRLTAGTWPETIIADAPPGGGTFASGDLETGDFDGDGDIDVIGVKHTGEWDGAHETAEIFWYDNPDWTAHRIGETAGAVKDLSVADFNADGRLDVAILNFNVSNLRVYAQQADGSFDLSVDLTVTNLHEGMDVGDLDGDGDIDIAANGYAFMNPLKGDHADWIYESIDEKWHNQEGDWSRNGTKHATADFDGDGKMEVVISHSERAGYPIAWYSRADDGTWAETVIIAEATACHTLQVADADLDGDLDLFAGLNFGRAVNLGVEAFPIYLFLNDGDASSFSPTEIDSGGIYNGRVADFEGDGDPDLFRLHSHEAKELHLYLNHTAGASPALAHWTYVEIDDQKAMWGEFDDPEWLRYFGLAAGDVDGDGLRDIISGRNVYLNPGDGMTASWAKLDIGENVDAMLAADLGAGAGRVSIIASKLPDVIRFDYDGHDWTRTVLAQIPPTGHHNGQGYRVADLIPGGHPEILLASQGGIYQIAANEAGSEWSVTHLAVDASDEGFAIGDVDGDGDLDLASGFRLPGKDPENPLLVVWFENPGDGSGDWTRHEIGMTRHAVDRVEMGDLDGDGRMDMAVAEELWPDVEPVASLWVYLQRDAGWERHQVVRQYTMNNLDLADMDGDGDLDLTTAEHKGPRLSVQIWANDGRASFSKVEIDLDKENHLGTRAYDMDGDGDLDLIGAGWDRHPFIHLWRNDATD